MYFLKVPVRVLVESTSWVGRSGRPSSYFDRGVKISGQFLFHRFLIFDDILQYKEHRTNRVQSYISESDIQCEMVIVCAHQFLCRKWIFQCLVAKIFVDLLA
jgi:hypothetical protein